MLKKQEKIYLSIMDITYLNRFIEQSEHNEALHLIRQRLPIDRRISRKEQC
jgi:hypothetical protein